MTRDVHYDIAWQPGTRRAERASIALDTWGGSTERIELTPIMTFQMRGLGYLSPDWNHGSWKGEIEIGTEEWRVDDLDPTEPFNVHVQQLVQARWGERSGVGVFEVLAINAHAPTGLQRAVRRCRRMTAVRRWLVREHGAPADVLELSSATVDAASPDEIVIEVEACALNFADDLLCRGTYQEHPALPFTPGLEVAGVVVDVADDDGPAVGDRVVGSAQLPFGALGERCRARVGDVYRLPADVPAVDAVAMHVTYQTCWFASAPPRTRVQAGRHGGGARRCRRRGFRGHPAGQGGRRTRDRHGRRSREGRALHRARCRSRDRLPQRRLRGAGERGDRWAQAPTSSSTRSAARPSIAPASASRGKAASSWSEPPAATTSVRRPTM